ncbi:hypothetical protein [Aliarcobacter butzleri]|uniref:hypothetical protein n=1 Tax=Aliarcobacter butzleri TaxID=28197 RepID=UPI003AF4C736
MNYDITQFNAYPVGTNQSSKEEYLFIWIDILGFSGIVEDDNKYNELYNILKKFQALFNNSHLYSTKIISDGLILFEKITKNEFTKIIEIIDDLSLKQFQFIKENGHFIRGGIAMGTKFEEIIIDGKEKDKENIFISNGLARAYNLESNNIQWPIIGINDKYLNLMKEYFNIHDNNETFNLKKAFNNNGESIYFINFIPDFEDQEYLELLYRSIEINKDKASVRNKYIWLLRHYLQKFKIEVKKEYEGYVL